VLTQSLHLLCVLANDLVTFRIEDTECHSRYDYALLPYADILQGRVPHLRHLFLNQVHPFWFRNFSSLHIGYYEFKPEQLLGILAMMTSLQCLELDYRFADDIKHPFLTEQSLSMRRHVQLQNLLKLDVSGSFVLLGVILRHLHCQSLTKLKCMIWESKWIDVADTEVFTAALGQFRQQAPSTLFSTQHIFCNRYHCKILPQSAESLVIFETIEPEEMSYRKRIDYLLPRILQMFPLSEVTKFTSAFEDDRTEVGSVSDDSLDVDVIDKCRIIALLLTALEALTIKAQAVFSPFITVDDGSSTFYPALRTLSIDTDVELGEDTEGVVIQKAEPEWSQLIGWLQNRHDQNLGLSTMTITDEAAPMNVLMTIASVTI
jgi:hypothetical protein